jgi:hypothetical protein
MSRATPKPPPKTKSSPKSESSPNSLSSPESEPATTKPAPKPKASAKVQSAPPRKSAQKSAPKSAPARKSSSHAAQPSPTDDFARRIARALDTGRPPPFSNDVDRFCASSPREVFPAFAGLARHMPPAGKDEGLALGYLFLLQHLLEHLRMRADSGFSDAAKLIAEFQADVVARVEAGEVDRRLLVLVSGALHQSKIPASPQFVAAAAKLGVAEESDDEAPPRDVRLAFSEIFESCDGDPFMAIDLLLEAGHAMPADARSVLAGALALNGHPTARSAAVLLLLDPEPATRRSAAGALLEVAAALTPTDMRRMIAMRNWRPESERSAVDAIIRKARASGIDCAQWEAGSVEKIMATAVDGSAAQVFVVLAPAGRKKKLLASVLTRNGIADAGCRAPASRRMMEECLGGLVTDTPTLPVSRAYLDCNMAHHLAHAVEKGEAGLHGLLQIAEGIGGADWQPARIDFRQALAGLIRDIPKRMREPATVASMLRKSGEPGPLRQLALLWYEEDPELAAAVAGAHVRPAKLATYLLQTVIGRRRDRWADITLRTALWLREAMPETVSCWSELALIAKALADGQDMTEIGLMHGIALRTIKVLRDAGRA